MNSQATRQNWPRSRAGFSASGAPGAVCRIVDWLKLPSIVYVNAACTKLPISLPAINLIHVKLRTSTRAFPSMGRAHDAAYLLVLPNECTGRESSVILEWPKPDEVGTMQCDQGFPWSLGIADGVGLLQDII